MSSPASPPKAPVATRRIHRQTWHGVVLEDAYAWLRDPHYPQVETPEILAYLQAENQYFSACMQPLAPLVETLFAEMKARQVPADEGVPYREGAFFYQWRFHADHQYRTWYRAPLQAPENWQLLLDENRLADRHDFFALGDFAVSPCGGKLAYSADTHGDERYTLCVVDLDSGEELTQAINATDGSMVWGSDSQALLYVPVNEQWQPLQVRLRQLQSSPDADSLIFEESDPAYRVQISLSQSAAWVCIESGKHNSNETYIVPRDHLGDTPLLLRPREENVEYHVDHGNGAFFIRSNLRHQNFDLYRLEDTAPQQTDWELLLAGDDRLYLTGHIVLDGYLIVEERADGVEQIRVRQHCGDTHHIPFTEASYSVGIGAHADFASTHLRLYYNSLTTPHTVFDYDLERRQLIERKVQRVPGGYEAHQYVTARLLAEARDGTRVPISLVYHRDTPIDGSAPLYLYAYGAYGLGTPVNFSSTRLSLLERGFIYAIAHVRGGDELGYPWYAQGKLDQRNNTFNDFVDCAETLIEKGYTRSGRLVISGGSAGGELMAAVVNQAPQLWGAVAAHVPFVDVLNTMLDASLPLTPPEWSEWGNPIEDADAFALIRAYSPYDQLKAGHFPPMLVTAGLNDPRVTYWEPAKYVAKLRTLKKDSHPLLLKTHMGAGHAGQSGRYEALRETAEEYAFLLDALAKQVLYQEAIA